MKIGILGSGLVGRTLAEGFIGHGHNVMVGSRNPEKMTAWQKDIGRGVRIGDFAQTASFGDIVVLAIKGTAAEECVKLAGTDVLAGKTVLDATNPIADAEPTQGVLKFFTNLDESLMERLQKLAPRARFVKAFNSVGAAFMIEPKFESKPTMFICGNDNSAKEQAREIIEKCGWEVEDMGGAVAARAIEPLCMLWCIPGFRENRWAHAFKLLKL